MKARSDAGETWPDDRFEKVEVCPWCDGSSLATEVTDVRDWYFGAIPGAFSFSRCLDCGALVLDTRPKPEYLPRAYEGYYTHDEGRKKTAPKGSLVQRARSTISSGYVRSRYGQMSDPLSSLVGRFYTLFPSRRREMDVIQRFLPRSPGIVLDYGCGDGAFLGLAKGHGHHPIGVDFDPDARRVATQKGVEAVAPEALPSVLGDRQLDYVSAAHVIEHVPDPKNLLLSFRRWTKSGAVLFLEIPNALAVRLYRYGAYWRGLEAPRHFSLPCRDTLKDALVDAGFSDVTFHPRPSVKDWLWLECDQALATAGVPRRSARLRNVRSSDEEEFLTVTARAS